jgi:pimeloyl-ACP methyl ester carboxylesterase
MSKSTYQNKFAKVSGIRLHYIDWGGNGDILLFLAGLGSSAHLFEKIALRFTDKFHVLGLTRRGQGASDYPETGYDLDTLVDDINEFMNIQSINQVILAGHSFAGKEITYFAEKYPDKVLKLVYLDAAYDSRGRFEVYKNDPSRDFQTPEKKEEFESIDEYIAHIKSSRPYISEIWNESFDISAAYDLETTALGKYIEKDTSSIDMQMIEGANRHAPQNAKIQVPVLSFVAISTPTPPAFYTEEQKRLFVQFWREKWIPFQKEEMSLLKNQIPHAKVIEIPNGHHYCFIAQEELVYTEMRKFLIPVNEYS